MRRGLVPARKLGTRCKLEKYNACLHGEFTASPRQKETQCWWVRLPQFLICPVDLHANDRKVTPSAGCSFLYVCFIMVGTYCNWGLKAFNKQCQPLGHNKRPVWNPKNYTLALSSTKGFQLHPS